jgi:hypothetical protein
MNGFTSVSVSAHDGVSPGSLIVTAPVEQRAGVSAEAHTRSVRGRSRVQRKVAPQSLGVAHDFMHVPG